MSYRPVMKDPLYNKIKYPFCQEPRKLKINKEKIGCLQTSEIFKDV